MKKSRSESTAMPFLAASVQFAIAFVTGVLLYSQSFWRDFKFANGLGMAAILLIPLFLLPWGLLISGVRSLMGAFMTPTERQASIPFQLTWSAVAIAVALAVGLPRLTRDGQEKKEEAKVVRKHAEERLQQENVEEQKGVGFCEFLSDGQVLVLQSNDNRTHVHSTGSPVIHSMGQDVAGAIDVSRASESALPVPPAAEGRLVVDPDKNQIWLAADPAASLSLARPKREFVAEGPTPGSVLLYEPATQLLRSVHVSSGATLWSEPMEGSASVPKLALWNPERVWTLLAVMEGGVKRYKLLVHDLESIGLGAYVEKNITASGASVSGKRSHRLFHLQIPGHLSEAPPSAEAIASEMEKRKAKDLAWKDSKLSVTRAAANDWVHKAAKVHERSRATYEAEALKSIDRAGSQGLQYWLQTGPASALTFLFKTDEGVEGRMTLDPFRVREPDVVVGPNAVTSASMEQRSVNFADPLNGQWIGGPWKEVTDLKRSVTIESMSDSKSYTSDKLHVFGRLGAATLFAWPFSGEVQLFRAGLGRRIVGRPLSSMAFDRKKTCVASNAEGNTLAIAVGSDLQIFHWAGEGPTEQIDVQYVKLNIATAK